MAGSAASGRGKVCTPATDNRVETQPEHEDRHDDADGVEIHAVPAEERALPCNLIEQRAKTAGEEKRARQGKSRVSYD
jgi:hypothetical protein